MFTIKIAKVPGAVKEIVMEDGATVGDALEIYAEEFGEETAGFTVRYNGADNVAGTTELVDGAKLYLVQQMKGNF